MRYRGRGRHPPVCLAGLEPRGCPVGGGALRSRSSGRVDRGPRAGGDVVGMGTASDEPLRSCGVIVDGCPRGARLRGVSQGGRVRPSRGSGRCLAASAVAVGSMGDDRRRPRRRRCRVGGGRRRHRARSGGRRASGGRQTDRFSGRPKWTSGIGQLARGWQGDLQGNRLTRRPPPVDCRPRRPKGPRALGQSAVDRTARLSATPPAERWPDVDAEPPTRWGGPPSRVRGAIPGGGLPAEAVPRPRPAGSVPEGRARHLATAVNSPQPRRCAASPCPSFVRVIRRR